LRRVDQDISGLDEGSVGEIVALVVVHDHTEVGVGVADISRAIGLVCPDDKTAMEHVKQFVDGHDVELWQHDCKISSTKHE
jgi:pyruvoyl-dependent arginine decarboxylase (PvlArgDC)